MTGEESQEESRPMLRVVRGEPSDDELAALVTVVASRGAGSNAAAPPAPTSRWADRAAGLRRPLTPGPGAWRASAWPG